MKKTIILILITILIITGCSNKNEIEVITNFEIYYNSSIEKLDENSNKIYNK